MDSKAILKQYSFLSETDYLKMIFFFPEILWAPQLHGCQSNELKIKKNLINHIYFILDYLQ